MFGSWLLLPQRRECFRRPPLVLALAFLAIATLAVTARVAPAAALFVPPFPSLGAGVYPVSVVIGDLNGDGKPDVAVANMYDNTVSVMLGNGNGTFGAKTDFATGTGPYSLAIGDLNGDGKLDLATANMNVSTVSVLPGNGNGTFGAKTDLSTGSKPYSVAIGDLNGDGKPDLATANYYGNSVSVLLGNGNGTFGTRADYGTGSYPTCVAIGDLNADGKLDLAVANYGYTSSSNTVSVLLGYGNGSFGTKTDYATGSFPYCVAIGDLNRDGKPDLAVANSTSNTVSVMLGNGDGTFGTKSDFATGTAPLCVAIGDLDGDGKPDLVVADEYMYTVSVLLGTGTGAFGPKTDYGTGINPFSVAIRDLNGDRRPDVVVADYGSNAVAVMINLGGTPWVGVPVSTAASAALRVQASPNPVADRTAISFSLPAPGQASVCVYDVSGRLVSTLVRGTMTAGAHEARWRLNGAAGTELGAGVYLVELRAGVERAATRVVVLE